MLKPLLISGAVVHFKGKADVAAGIGSREFNEKGCICGGDRAGDGTVADVGNAEVGACTAGFWVSKW